MCIGTPRCAAAPPALVPAPIEPTFFKRWTADLTAYPNIALTPPETQMMMPAVSGCAAFTRPVQQLDIAPNLAVRFAITYTPPPALDLPTKARGFTQPDLAPNLAVNLQTVKMPPRRCAARAQVAARLDLFPNLAALRSTAAVHYPCAIDPQLFCRLQPSVILAPNIVARVAVEPPKAIPAPIEPTIAKRYPPQIDVYPALALITPPPPYLIPAPIEPQIIRLMDDGD